MSDPITIGELRVILKRLPRKFDRNRIALVVVDDDARGTIEAPGIKMEGVFDYVISPNTKEEVLRFFAGGEARI